MNRRRADAEVPLQVSFSSFRTTDAALAQQVNDWLRDDIDQALTKASEIRPALLSEDPWATWYRDNIDDKDIEKAKRTEKRKAGK